MDKLIDLLSYKYPELIAMVMVGISVWIIAKFYFKRFIPMENKIKSHDKDIDKILESILNIEKYIIKKDITAIDGFLKKSSPYTITDAGKKLLAVSGGKKCIDDNITFFNNEIQKLNPKVALDVENYALSVLNKNTNNAFFNPIKNFIFNAPNPYTIIDENGNAVQHDSLTMNVILLIMSIYLRDKYFEQYPNYLLESKKMDIINS